MSTPEAIVRLVVLAVGLALGVAVFVLFIRNPQITIDDDAGLGLIVASVIAVVLTVAPLVGAPLDAW